MTIRVLKQTCTHACPHPRFLSLSLSQTQDLLPQLLVLAQDKVGNIRQRVAICFQVLFPPSLSVTEKSLSLTRNRVCVCVCSVNVLPSTFRSSPPPFSLRQRDLSLPEREDVCVCVPTTCCHLLLGPLPPLSLCDREIPLSPKERMCVCVESESVGACLRVCVMRAPRGARACML